MTECGKGHLSDWQAGYTEYLVAPVTAPDKPLHTIPASICHAESLMQQQKPQLGAGFALCCGQQGRAPLGAGAKQHQSGCPVTDQHGTMLAVVLSSQSPAMSIASAEPASTLLQLARHVAERPPVLQAA